jgi:GMP synthase (glutamine-hydrolysing)
MICFVDIEHEKVLRDPEKRNTHLALYTEIKLKLEEISGEACLVQHFSRVTGQRLKEWDMKALIISGNATDWEEYGETDLAEMYRIIRAAELPILGLCGGLQLIALAHGAPIGPMRLLREGESDPNAEDKPGHFKEWGFMPVRVPESDPLFEGLDKEPVFFQAHYWEVKEALPHFRVLASTDECRIQAIKHREKLVYGTQFHPEMYEEEQADGRRLLANFFRLAGILK